MLDVAWSGDQFQFDEQLLSSGTSEGKLDDFGFGSPSSPSSPSSDELVDIPLALPILDPTDLLNPTLTFSETFLLPSIFNTETILDAPASFQIPPSGPYSVGKRHHDQTLEQNPLGSKPGRSHKGKKLKVDGNTKRERNKVSAAKYRQRRKVYLDGLEDHVRQLNEKLEAQAKTIASLKTENQMLKEQTSYLKKLVESFTLGKTPIQSISPINRIMKENSLGKAVKPMGAGLFLLAICCLVFSFQSFNDAPMSTLPVRGASRSLLHHENALALHEHEDDHNNNDSTPFVSLPIDGPPEYPADGIVETVINVELSIEPAFETMETIATRHSLGQSGGVPAA